MDRASKRNIERERTPSRRCRSATASVVCSPILSILSWSRRHRALVAIAGPVPGRGFGRRHARADLRHRRPPPAAARRPRDSRVPHVPRDASAASISSTSCSAAPAGRQIRDYDDEIDAWIERAARRRRRSRGSTPAPSTRTRDSDLARRPPAAAARRRRRWPPRSAASAATACAQAVRRRRGAADACRRLRSPQLVRHDPLGLFDLMRDQLGGIAGRRQSRVTEGGYVDEGRHAAGSCIAQPARRRTTRSSRARSLPALDAIRADDRSRRARRRSGERRRAPPAAAGGVRRRPPHRDRDRGGGPAREHLEHASDRSR